MKKELMFSVTVIKTSRFCNNRKFLDHLSTYEQLKEDHVPQSQLILTLVNVSLNREYSSGVLAGTGTGTGCCCWSDG